MLKKNEKVLNKVNSCILQYLNYSVSVSTAVSRNDQHSYLLTAPSSLDSSASFSLLFRILCFRFFPILYVCVLPASSTLIELEQDNWIRKKQQLTLVICTVNPAMILFNFLIIKYKTFNCHMLSCSCYEYIICLPNADGWGEEGILEGACQWLSVFLAVLLCWWPGGGFHSFEGVFSGLGWQDHLRFCACIVMTLVTELRKDLHWGALVQLQATSAKTNKANAFIRY